MAGETFPSFNVNPITSIVLRFFVEYITYMPDVTYPTHIMEIPLSSIIPTGETAEERHEGDTVIHLLTCY